MPKNLAAQTAQDKLLLLTGGKPNDRDHYTSRFDIDYTRRAMLEARRQGMRVFGLIIDAAARAYFAALFGRGGFAIAGDAAKLPQAMKAGLRHAIRN